MYKRQVFAGGFVAGAPCQTQRAALAYHCAAYCVWNLFCICDAKSWDRNYSWFDSADCVCNLPYIVWIVSRLSLIHIFLLMFWYYAIWLAMLMKIKQWMTLTWLITHQVWIGLLRVKWVSYCNWCKMLFLTKKSQNIFDKIQK